MPTLTGAGETGTATGRRRRHALVAGGTGLVGSALLDLLALDPRYQQVTSLVRRAVAERPPVRSVVVSFDDLDRAALAGVDDAYCCLGTTRRAAGSAQAFRHVDYGYVLAYARAAKRAGARRFLLVSPVGANPRSRFLYPRVKGEVEAAIQTLGFPVMVILRPSFLRGQRAQARTGEAVPLAVSKLIGPLLVGPLRRYQAVEARTVAAALRHMAFTAPDGVSLLASDQLPAAAAEPD